MGAYFQHHKIPSWQEAPNLSRKSPIRSIKLTCQDHFQSAFCRAGDKNNEFFLSANHLAPGCFLLWGPHLPVSVPIALGVFFSSGPAAADVQRCGSMVVPGMGVKEGKVLVKSSGFNGSAGI